MNISMREMFIRLYCGSYYGDGDDAGDEGTTGDVGNVVDDAADAAAARGDGFTPTEDVKKDDVNADANTDVDTDDKKADIKSDVKSDSDDDTKTDSKDDAQLQVPKSRMDRALQRARKAEALTKTLQEEKAKSTDADVTSLDDLGGSIDEIVEKVEDLDDKIEDARADGDAALLKSLRAERRDANRDLRAKERTYTQQAATERAQSSGDVAVEQVRYDTSLAQAEADYPEINPDSDSFSQDVVDEVLDLKEAFEARGYTAADALQRATGYVIGGPKVVQEVDKRKTDVKKNVDASNNQPPDLNKAGIDSDKVGATDTTPTADKLTDAELDALPEETRKRMRGDFF